MNGTRKRRRRKKQAPVLRVSARRRKKSNERTMRLLGVTSVAELQPEHVTQLHRLLPRE